MRNGVAIMSKVGFGAVTEVWEGDENRRSVEEEERIRKSDRRGGFLERKKKGRWIERLT
jgi:hypothetical protein